MAPRRCVQVRPQLRETQHLVRLGKRAGRDDLCTHPGALSTVKDVRKVIWVLLFVMVHAAEHGVAQVHGDLDIRRHRRWRFGHLGPSEGLHLLPRTPTMPNRVQLYFDCVSPWSYIAFHALRRYRKAWDMHIEYFPRSLAYIMKFAENRPPVAVANKGAHMMQELRVASRMHNVPVQMPNSFPFETFALMGFLHKVKELYPEKLEHLVEQSFATIWRDGRPLQNADQIRAMAAQSFAQNEGALTELLEYATSRDARRALSAASQELVDEGAFGFPWIVASRASDSEEMPVFGVDHLEVLAAFFHKAYLGPQADGQTPRL